MQSIVPFLSDTPFGREEIEAMSVALDRAVRLLDVDPEASRVKQDIARRIVAAARAGERDPDALAAHALGDY